jgi:hypothetical protein
LFYNNIDIERELEHELTRRFPQMAYDGGIKDYEDEQDYTAAALKGVRIG